MQRWISAWILALATTAFGNGEPANWRCVQLVADGSRSAPIGPVTLLKAERDEDSQISVVLGLPAQLGGMDRILGVQSVSAMNQRGLRSELNPTDLYFRLKTQAPPDVISVGYGEKQHVQFRLPVQRGPLSNEYTLSFDAGMLGGFQRWSLYRLNLADPAQVSLTYAGTYTYVGGKTTKAVSEFAKPLPQVALVRDRIRSGRKVAWFKHLLPHRTYFRVERLEPERFHFAVSLPEEGGRHLYHVAADTAGAFERLSDARLHREPIFRTVRGTRPSPAMEGFASALRRRVAKLATEKGDVEIVYLGRYRRLVIEEIVPHTVSETSVIGQSARHALKFDIDGNLSVDPIRNLGIYGSYGILFDVDSAPARAPKFVRFALEGDEQGSMVLADLNDSASPWRPTLDRLQAAVYLSLNEIDMGTANSTLADLAPMNGKSRLPEKLDQNIAFSVGIYGRTDGSPPQAHQTATVVVSLDELMKEPEVRSSAEIGPLALKLDFVIRYAAKAADVTVSRANGEVLGTGAFEMDVEPVFDGDRQALSYGHLVLRVPGKPKDLWQTMPGDAIYRSFDLVGDLVLATYRNGPKGREPGAKLPGELDPILLSEAPVGTGDVVLTPVEAPPKPFVPEAVPDQPPHRPWWWAWWPF